MIVVDLNIMKADTSNNGINLEELKVKSNKVEQIYESSVDGFSKVIVRPLNLENINIKPSIEPHTFRTSVDGFNEIYVEGIALEDIEVKSDYDKEIVYKSSKIGFDTITVKKITDIVLTHEEFINLLNNLQDGNDNLLKLTASNINKLTNEEKEIIINKKWKL